MNMHYPTTSVSSWDAAKFSIDMQGPLDMTYSEAYKEAMQCLLPTLQPGLAAHSPICDYSAESLTAQQPDALSESSADGSNASYSASSSRSQSPASSQIPPVDLSTGKRLLKRQKNRDAQRAYRERKERLLRTLEEKIESLEVAYSMMKDERDQLQESLDRLTNTTGLAKGNMLGFDGQYGAFTDFQFNNFLFSDLPPQRTVLPLS
ncbi:hypothetical protein GGI43DRAFT_194281 [Trichoderma evansii]